MSTTYSVYLLASRRHGTLDAAFLSDSADAVVAAVPFDPGALRPAAE